MQKLTTNKVVAMAQSATNNRRDLDEIRYVIARICDAFDCADLFLPAVDEWKARGAPADPYEAECDARAAADFERDAYGCDGDPACTQDDEFDSRGQPLRPRMNDAGEPWWM